MPTRTPTHASRARVAFTCLTLFIALASFLSGQQKPPAPTGMASDSAQPAKHDYHFEVASIRPVGPPTGHEYPSGVIPPSYTPGHYRDEKQSLAGLACVAFEVKYPFQIEYPSWMASTFFAVNAVLPEGATKADLPVMMQHLLEERFRLVSHREMRLMQGNELVVAKSGAKLERSQASTSDRGLVSGRNAIEFKNGEPQIAKNASSIELYSDATAIWHGRNKTMQDLADEISHRLDGPVNDATGLKGEYDYTMTFTPEFHAVQGSVVSPLPPRGAPSLPAGEDEPNSHPLLRDALQEQLGLKLQPIKNVPVSVVVVDTGNKEPTEN